MDVALFSSPTWFYIDSLGYERGPFSPDEMWGWYHAGYFPADLMVRRTMRSTFTRIASLALGNAAQPMVNFGPAAIQQYVTRRENVRDGKHIEKIKKEGTIGTSVHKNRGIIKKEEVGSLLKQEFKEKRSHKIEVKREYIETEIKDEYIKPEVRDEYITFKDEYRKSEVKKKYIKPVVKDEYIKLEVKDECITPQVKNKRLKTEFKDEYLKPEVNMEYKHSEVKWEYITLKTAIKDEDIESDIHIVSLGNESDSITLNVDPQVKALRIRYVYPYIEIKTEDSFEDKPDLDENVAITAENEIPFGSIIIARKYEPCKV